MKIQLLKETDYTVSRWSGGTTTEIGIGPDGTCYQERNFLWRISSATVDLAESTFTSLPEYERWILTLDKPITLYHNENTPVSLSPFAIHRFDGADSTRAIGQCTDFNLMLRKGKCRGHLQALCVERNGCAIPCAESQTVFVYCAKGSCLIRTVLFEVTLCEKECLRMDDVQGVSLELSSDTQTHCVIAEIKVP